MIYGTPQFKIEDDTTDRVGLRTLVMSKMWQASRWPMTQAELDAEEPEPPQLGGGMLLLGSQTRPRGGALRTSWTFEGVRGDGKTVTFKGRHNSLEYGFDPGFSDVDLLLHPKIQEFLDDWGGQVIDGKIVWPSTVDSGAVTTGLGGGGGGEITNPFFGRQSFLRIEGTYRIRYLMLADNSPAGIRSLENLVGKIFAPASVPGLAPRIGDRDFLHAGAPYERRGPVLDVTEIFWMSGPGGWPKELYGQGSQR